MTVEEPKIIGELRKKSIGEKTIELGLDKILRPEQLLFLEKEFQIKQLELDQEGRIIFPETEQEDTLGSSWLIKDGVIDAKSIDGVVVVVFNSNEQVPEGCRNVREIASHGQLGRAGEYNPETNICSVDISSTWDFLNDKYQPQWVQQTARHELRHALVHQLDEKYSLESGLPERRNLDEDTMDREVHLQLAYLDELHGQYMDAIEGEIEGITTFRTVNEIFYSVANEGKHEDVASSTDDGKKIARDIFHILQALILSKRMIENNARSTLNEKIDIYCTAVASVLATERSLEAALSSVQKLWDQLREDANYRESMDHFMTGYKPDESGSNNTPELTEELLSAMKMKELD